MSPQELSIEERTGILERHIGEWVKRGYQVVSRTDTTAQLVKPKDFNFLWAILWFLALGIGIVVYLLYYLAKKDRMIYLEIDLFGNVSRK